MRPVGKPQSALRNPLNHILGREANIRVLRLLALEDTPQTSPKIARKTGLSAQGVRLALEAMEKTGMVEFKGVGRSRYPQLRLRHPLADSLVGLFAAEQDHAQEVMRMIREIFSELTLPPNSVWIEGALARGTDKPDSSMTIGFLAGARDLDSIRDEAILKIRELEQSRDLMIELKVYTRADFMVLSSDAREYLKDVISLLGPVPKIYFNPPKTEVLEHKSNHSHSQSDERLRKLGSAIADATKRDSGLSSRALAFVQNRLKKEDPQEARELREWKQILLTASDAKLRRFLVDRGERATRLRQTLPFLHILSDDERNKIFSDVERNDGGDTL